MPKPPSPPNIQLLFPDQALSLEPRAFDAAVRQQGVECRHFRGVPCPVGLDEPDGIRRSHAAHPGCSNGFLYRDAGLLIVLFQQAGKEILRLDPGLLDGSTAYATCPTHYEPVREGAERVRARLAVGDRIYFDDPGVLVVEWEQVRHSGSRRDRLRRPAVEVEELVDSLGRHYRVGQDLDLVGGELVWRQGREPGLDRDGRGVVLSARYLHRPYYYVTRLLHETRTAQVPAGPGGRETASFPQEVLLQREASYESAPPDRRTGPVGPPGAPLDTGLGIGTGRP